jgi:hypothetical protein
VKPGQKTMQEPGNLAWEDFSPPHMGSAELLMYLLMKHKGKRHVFDDNKGERVILTQKSDKNDNMSINKHDNIRR